MSPASSSPGGYPVHGALALSNVPDESSYQENIPDLSFSLRPPSTPAPIEAPEKEVPESNLLMTAPQPTRLGYLMPTSYQEPPTYVQMANPAILRRPTLLSKKILNLKL